MLCHSDNVLSGVREVDRALPRHHTKYVERQQHARRVQLSIGSAQEVADYVAAMPGWVLGLESESGVFLIAFSREANIVELHFIHTRQGCLLRERNIVILHLDLRRIGPD